MTDPTWSLSTLNVNGIRAAVRHGLWDWIQAQDPDVLCLQEVRMQVAQATDKARMHLAPADWTSSRADAEKKGYAGTAVWTRLPVSAQGTGCGMPTADREGRVSWVDLFGGEDTVRVYSIYFPSGTSGEERQAVKDAFNTHIQRLLRPHLERGERVAVCGDVNTAHTAQDIHNPSGNKKNSGFLPHERAWMTGLLEDGWVDLFRAQHPKAQEYSWWSNRGQARAKDRGWRIDYILCSPALAARALSCDITGREPRISDHCAVNATFRR